MLLGRGGGRGGGLYGVYVQDLTRRDIKRWK